MIDILIAIAVGLLLVWAILITALWVARPEDLDMRQALRLLPDTLRLLRRMASDSTVPHTSRWLLWALLGYLAMPVDLVPDFVPVIGYADDIIVVIGVLRFVIRRTGTERVRHHWPGTPEGLAALACAAGLPNAEDEA